MEPNKEQREHELTVNVFVISSGLVGVCLTAIGLIRVVVAQTNVSTVADNILAADSVLFMICCFLAFWSFKTRFAKRRVILRQIIDSLFMLALATMVGVCVLIAYALL